MNSYFERSMLEKSIVNCAQIERKVVKKRGVRWQHRSLTSMKLRAFFYLLFTVIFFTCLSLIGCSLTTITVNTTAKMIKRGLPALYEEADLEVAETALVSNLKLLEVLLKNDPGNTSILLLLAQGYNAYALGFVEDDEPERARYFYLKGRDFALEVLNSNQKFQKIFPKPLAEFDAFLLTLDEKYLEALFWCAGNWGNWIMLSLDDPRAIFELAKVEAMMSRVLELDETYYFAGAHLFFGSLLAARPAMFGGKPDLAQQHFEKALTLTDHKFLLTKVYYARFYAVRLLDEELFTRLLTDVIEADVNILPHYTLITTIAKKKAQLWLTKKEDLF
ncbi:TRAP transporter TatT component family protein [candidate division CSSED10-310 bacterium]|uniref:TRAP transporter TatT component family protein n=1 Tax=candidate division CSSED10-310 bacterium TaxID=2855610 RepID=A0ABV6YTE8_UNCC1